MTPSPTSKRSFPSNVLSGVLGGLAVLVVGSVLIATGVIDTGDTKREVIQQQAPVSRPAANSANGRTVGDIYRQEGRGVVFVEARGVSESDSPFGLPSEQGTATGSGFVVDADGTIITNAHVVEGSDDVTVRFDENGEPIDAQVKGRDVSSDLAVLKIDPSDVRGGLEPMPLGNSADVSVGDPVVAIGNPFGYTRTVTTGIVSAKQRQITAPNGFPIRNVIQTDASINPGNSGGPLLDAQGRVIGITSQIATGGGQGSVGIGFAIPIDTAKALLPKLERGETVKRAWLGVQMAAVTERLARQLDLPSDSGALIQDVVSGGPAADAGLRGGSATTDGEVRAGGDLIVRVDGKRVRTPDDVANAIASNQPGDEVRIEYFRGDDRRSAEVKLGERPNELADDTAQSGPDVQP
ncbi:MAG: S1C family serine protease [Nocardioidaceae bacterium]